MRFRERQEKEEETTWTGLAILCWFLFRTFVLIICSSSRLKSHSLTKAISQITKLHCILAHARILSGSCLRYCLSETPLFSRCLGAFFKRKIDPHPFVNIALFASIWYTTYLGCIANVRLFATAIASYLMHTCFGHFWLELRNQLSVWMRMCVWFDEWFRADMHEAFNFFLHCQ